MNKMLRAYLFDEGTVVLDKSVIANSKEGHCKEVSLVISAEQIKEMYEEMQQIYDFEDEEDVW